MTTPTTMTTSMITAATTMMVVGVDAVEENNMAFHINSNKRHKDDKYILCQAGSWQVEIYVESYMSGNFSINRGVTITE